jgi:hypothetical protein
MMIWVLVGASVELEKTAKLDAWVKPEVPHGSFSKRDKGVGALVPSPTTTPELAETTPSNPRMTPARQKLCRGFSIHKVFQSASLNPLLSFFNSLPVLIVGVSFADFVCFKGLSSTHVPQTNAKAPQLEQTRVEVI